MTYEESDRSFGFIFPQVCVEFQNGLLIRSADANDSQIILDLTKELAQQLKEPSKNINVAQFRDLGFGRHVWFSSYLAVVDERVVGYAIVCPRFEGFSMQKQMWIGDLYIMSKFRRKGIAKALFHVLGQVASASGCDNIFWDLWNLNEKGKKFYRSIGATWENEREVLTISSHNAQLL